MLAWLKGAKPTKERYELCRPLSCWNFKTVRVSWQQSLLSWATDYAHQNGKKIYQQNNEKFLARAIPGKRGRNAEFCKTPIQRYCTVTFNIIQSLELHSRTEINSWAHHLFDSWAHELTDVPIFQRNTYFPAQLVRNKYLLAEIY